MAFSSPIFLFLFLPVVLTLYLLIPKSFKNSYLLFFSLIFYFWAERTFGWVMVFSILVNYLLIIGLDYFANKKKHFLKKSIFIVGIIFNIFLLITFKYANFFLRELSILGLIFGLPMLPVISIPLAAGISFYTFHAISYLVDVFKGMPAQKNLITHGLYISFFPQLIAGPIIRYHTIANELVKRRVSVELFSEGIERFILGLAKKVLIANNLAIIADGIFATEPTELGMGMAWLGIVCYSLQIYFDFSGYSDMAIGLARMFGFHFPENFNYPYIAQSVTEFWRRWHISLSSWFRDYVYIPLGGNRKGNYRTFFNLILVFLLCGFWHGASWNFIVWGLWYGMFLVIERWKGLRLLQYTWRPYRHIYLLLVVMMGWVFFRSNDLTFAFHYFRALLGFNEYVVLVPTAFEIHTITVSTIIGAIIFALPVYPMIRKYIISKASLFGNNNIFKIFLQFSYYSILFFLFILSSMMLAVQTYNPFIYFRF